MNRLVHPDLLEMSFYLAEHHRAEATELRLSHSNNAIFAVRLEGVFDVHGFGDLDGDDIPFVVEGDVTFKGLVVVPDNLYPKPTTAAEAKAVSHPFLDLSDFAEPKWDRFRFVLEPRENAV